MKRAERERLDRLLVEKGLTRTRAKAQALILAGQVMVEGRPSGKAGQAVARDSRIEVLERMPYVSRGGLKLAAALGDFGIQVAGRVCLDVGASTGGFTDCLLQRGAARVYAIDVGAGQLDWKLRNDPRVILKEGLNARHLGFEDIGERVDLVVCDVSFISVTLVLGPVAALLKDTGEMVILVKPQFEARRGQVGKGGIVRDPAVWQAACSRVEAAVRQLGFTASAMESPVRGAEGNKEFLMYARH
jgi:23S rRNA (cytidine1920-2'-O)/16S rRNA (cytidine1409-2'-O)-methyltransferase